MRLVAEHVSQKPLLGCGSERGRARFEIRYLAEKRILVSTLRGFWTEETAHEYQQTLHHEMAAVRRTCRRFTCLSDAREFPVQSEKVMKLLAAQSPANEGVRKLAIVVSTALNTLQAQRSFRLDGIRTFKDMNDATRWLLEAK